MSTGTLPRDVINKPEILSLVFCVDGKKRESCTVNTHFIYDYAIGTTNKLKGSNSKSVPFQKHGLWNSTYKSTNVNIYAAFNAYKKRQEIVFCSP